MASSLSSAVGVLAFLAPAPSMFNGCSCHCGLAWLPWDCVWPWLHVLDMILISLPGLVSDLCCRHGLAWWSGLVATSGAAPLPYWGGQTGPAGLEIPIPWAAASSCWAWTGKQVFSLLLKLGQSSLDQPWCVNMMAERFCFGGVFSFWGERFEFSFVLSFPFSLCKVCTCTHNFIFVKPLETAGGISTGKWRHLLVWLLKNKRAAVPKLVKEK